MDRNSEENHAIHDAIVRENMTLFDLYIRSIADCMTDDVLEQEELRVEAPMIVAASNMVLAHWSNYIVGTTKNHHTTQDHLNGLQN
jgi:hypothetical protein